MSATFRKSIKKHSFKISIFSPGICKEILCNTYCTCIKIVFKKDVFGISIKFIVTLASTKNKQYYFQDIPIIAPRLLQQNLKKV